MSVMTVMMAARISAIVMPAKMTWSAVGAGPLRTKPIERIEQRAGRGGERAARARRGAWPT